MAMEITVNDFLNAMRNGENDTKQKMVLFTLVHSLLSIRDEMLAKREKAGTEEMRTLGRLYANFYKGLERKTPSEGLNVESNDGGMVEVRWNTDTLYPHIVIG